MNWIVWVVAGCGVLVIAYGVFNQLAIDRVERQLKETSARLAAARQRLEESDRRLTALAEVVRDDALHATASAERDGSCPGNDGDSEPWPGQ